MSIDNNDDINNNNNICLVIDSKQICANFLYKHALFPLIYINRYQY